MGTEPPAKGLLPWMSIDVLPHVAGCAPGVTQNQGGCSLQLRDPTVTYLNDGHGDHSNPAHISYPNFNLGGKK